MEATIFFRDRDVIDAGLATAHQTVLVELPLFVAIGAVPLAVGVMPFVLKANGDAVVVERPEVLDQAIVQLVRPFARQERDNRVAACKKLGAVTPAAVFGVSQRNANRIA